MNLLSFEITEKTEPLQLDDEHYTMFTRKAAYPSGETVIFCFGLREEATGAVLYYQSDPNSPTEPMQAIEEGRDIKPYAAWIIHNLEERYSFPTALKVWLGMEEEPPTPSRQAVQIKFEI